MEDPRRPDPPSMESLTRALFALAGIRRDLRRRAGLDQMPAGLAALGAIKRLAPARVSDIAVELQVDLSVASRQVQALEADGLIERTQDPGDRRSSLVALSPAGEEKLRLVHRKLSAALEVAVADWEPGAVDALISGLLRLRDDLAVEGPGPIPHAGARPGAASPDSPDSNQESSL